MSTKHCYACGRNRPLSAYLNSRRRCASCVKEHGEARPAKPKIKPRPDDLERLTDEQITALGGDSPSTIKSRRVDLGIAIAHSLCKKGQVRTLEEIAAYANTSREAIASIERKALRKLQSVWSLT